MIRSVTRVVTRVVTRAEVIGLSVAPPARHPVLTPCTIPGVRAARCGTYEVWEDRDARAGRRIRLRIVVLPALGPDPVPDPVFYLSGGPGEAATEDVGDVAADLRSVRLHRDLVFVDMRGTSGPDRLQCRFYGDSTDIRSYLGDQFPIDEVVRCRDELSRRADLRLYTSASFTDDLDEVRQALGYNRINLFGVSYGTRAALVYLRRHPATVRSVVLNSVAPPDFAMPLPFARAAQDALDDLVAQCATDSACHAAFPRVHEELDSVLTRLEAGPATVTVHNPATGRSDTARFARGPFVERLRLLLYSPERAARLPMLIHQAYAGNVTAVAQLAADAGFATFNSISTGVYLSVTCAEDLPLAEQQDIAAATVRTFEGDYRVRMQARACATWPHRPLPPAAFSPVVAPQPVLLVEGGADPATPVRWAREAARTLPASRVIVVPHAGHGPGGPCISALMATFFERGSAAALDTACLDAFTRPPFVVSATVTKAQDSTVVGLVEHGRLAASRGDAAAAFRDFEGAYALAPTHPSVMYELARAAALTGRRGRALAVLAQLAPLGARDPGTDSGFRSLWGGAAPRRDPPAPTRPG